MNKGLLFLIIVLALGVAGYFFFANEASAPVVTQMQGSPNTLTVVGFWECVPKKAGYPQTEECTRGIAIDQSDGHMVVDQQFMAAPREFNPGTKVEVTGHFTPAMALSSSHWFQYDFDGIISATMITEVE